MVWKRHRSMLMATVGAFAGLAAAPAIAQEAPVPSTSPAEGSTPAVTGHATGAAEQTPSATAAPDAGEIVVTAQFRQQRLQDTPIAITAVNAAQLEARNQTNISQVAEQAPSVIVKPQGNAFGPSIAASIRGIGQADFNPAFEPGVGIYIDDVYYPQLTGALFDLLDLDRIEILRGPQGTLAGKNSIGGAIKLYSKKPVGDDTGFVSATYGSRQRIDVRASADFKLTDDLFARLSGVHKSQDGYVDQLDYGCVNPTGGIPRTRAVGSCKINDLSGVDYTAGRVMLRYAPAGGFEVNVIGDYTKENPTQGGDVLVATGGPYSPTNSNFTYPYDNRFICGKYCNYTTNAQAAGTFNSPIIPAFPLNATQGSIHTRYSGYGFSGDVHVPLGDKLALESISAYRNFHSAFTADDDLSPASVQIGLNRLSHYNWSQELRLNGKVGSTIDFTVGGFYFKERTTYYTVQDIRYAVIPLQFVGNDPVRSKSGAAFVTANWEVLPGLNLSGGVRYTHETKDYTYVRLNYDGTINPFLGALNGTTGSYRDNRIDYRANIDYRFSPELLVYANISTGFKGGGINPRPFNVAQVQPFGPEKSQNFEVGFKSDLFDRMLRLNVSAYYNKYDNIQIPLLSCPQFGGPGPCALPANAGNGRFKGVEAEATLRPIDHFTIDGSVSYLDFHFVKGSINPLAGGPSNPTGPQEGDPFANAPKWKWSIGAQYEASLGDDVGTLTPRVDASYQSRLFIGHEPRTAAEATANVPGALQFISSYALLNARLTYRSPGKSWDVSLEGLNLTNKYYYLQVFDLRAAGAGSKTANPGRPREWALTVKKTF